ncbi:MAG: murein L,D-transpeptidase [Verrucomicrobia bacterium]|nr:murein L,D-transpeptidase [Verrucomicrobiota bacterium]
MPPLANVPPGTARPPTAPSVPVPASEILETQIALDRAGFSVGSIDGVLGSQSRAALKVFQQERGILATGQLDTATRQALASREPALGGYVITAEDLSHLRATGKTWLAKSQQDYLGYENLIELVAEKSHAHPVLIQKLNPTVDWNALPAGAKVVVPNATPPAVPRARAARVRISLSSKTLQVFDAGDKLLAHFPVSIGRIAEKRPVGDLHVANAAPNPNYTFDPAVFPESPEAQKLGRKLVLPPGPNNPVGVAWIGLDRPGFGIHGTPNPEAVGRTESHGCFRLANWNAEWLVKIVWAGLPVVVEP